MAQFFSINDEMDARQPESKAIMSWLKDQQFTASASLHGVTLISVSCSLYIWAFCASHKLGCWYMEVKGNMHHITFFLILFSVCLRWQNLVPLLFLSVQCIYYILLFNAFYITRVNKFDINMFHMYLLFIYLLLLFLFYREHLLQIIHGMALPIKSKLASTTGAIFPTRKRDMQIKTMSRSYMYNRSTSS